MGILARDDPRTAGKGPLDLNAAGQALAEFFAGDPRVHVAYLFGSQASGKAGPRSDVDIAVRVAGHPSTDARDELRDELEAAIGALLGRPDVQVVVLNGAGAFLTYQVVRCRNVLFEREPGLALAESCRAFKEYVDMQPFWDRFTERARARIRERETDGWHPDHQAIAAAIRRVRARSAGVRRRDGG